MSKNNDSMDDAPELTAEEMKRARPARAFLTEHFGQQATEVFLEENQKKIGRPRKEHKAKPISIRLDPEIEAAFRATGKGWQTRINDVLRAHLPL